MGYKLLVTRDAHNDIDDIVTYIVQVLSNTDAAKGFLDDVERSYRNIMDNPFMYGVCTDPRLHKAGYRRIPIKRYIVVYRVDESAETVYIVRVIYGARDYAKLL